MLQRKRLTCTQLLEAYSTAGINHNDFKGVDKSERRLIWKEFCDKHYPFLAPCPFCKGTVEDGVEFQAKYFCSISSGGGGQDAVYCNSCALEFKGNYYKGSVVDQWNKTFKGEKE